MTSFHTALHYAVRIADARPAQPVKSAKAAHKPLSSLLKKEVPGKAAGAADRAKKINTPDENGLTPLHHACLEEDTCQMRKLMDQGADPYLKTHMGNSAFHMARENLAMLKILTRTENAPAFAECQNVHDFWAVIYPPSTTALPDNWEELTELIPANPLWEQLDQAITPEEREKLPTRKDLAIGLKEEEERQYEKDKKDGLPVPPRESYTLSISQVEAYLRKNHPLFDEALKLAGEPDIIMVPASDFQNKDGSTVHEKGESANYSAKTHTIRIEEGGGYAVQIEGIFFETMNAMQRKLFQKKDELLFAGDLSREDSTFLDEWLEYQSFAGFQKLFPTFICPEHKDLETSWKTQNKPFGEGLLSHAQFYREEWDTEDAPGYVVKNRKLFEDRLAKLTIQTVALRSI